jgi:hypothetical protein
LRSVIGGNGKPVDRRGKGKLWWRIADGPPEIRLGGDALNVREWIGIERAGIALQFPPEFLA